MGKIFLSYLALHFDICRISMFLVIRLMRMIPGLENHAMADWVTV